MDDTGNIKYICSGQFQKGATLAPLSQPNFTFLRTDSSLLSPDVLPFHDLHNASPASGNPRIADLATGKFRPERQGVIVHWMLPRAYRSGSAKSTTNSTQDLRQPKYRNSPDRWLVIRRLQPDSVRPAEALSKANVKEITAWVVESNRIRNIQSFDRDVDIELECSPFISGDSSDKSVDGQAEVFIGRKTELSQWNEQLTSQRDQYIPLTVVGAANPLFADYTAHNANVFSILDNFGWQNADKSKSYLTGAIASYYVVGWHADSVNDPMLNAGAPVTLRSVLKDLSWSMKVSSNPKLNFEINNWDSSQTVLHGAIYGVRYTPNGASDIAVPANAAAVKLADPLSHPVTVGTTPLDAVLAYLRAHQSDTAQTKLSPADQSLKEAEANILQLQTLLLKQEDDVDSQQEAFDMLSANNFQPASDSGGHWHFSAADGSGAAPIGPSPSTATTTKANVFTPTPKQIKDLANLNAAQMALDATNRELRSERYNLFAIWWKYIVDTEWQASSFSTTLNQKRDDQVKLVKDLESKRDMLTALVAKCLVPLGGGQSDNTKQLVQKASQACFYTQKDPTVLVPGIENPWPNDWLDSTLPVRLSGQVLPQDLGGKGWSGLSDIQKLVKQKLPTGIQGAVNIVISEFFNLSSDGNKAVTGVLPLYRDHYEQQSRIEGLNTDGSGRDQWSNSQPWFPLFMEWEVRYYHIPAEKWKFEEVDSNPIPGNPTHWRYGIQDGVSVEMLTDDNPNIQPPEERIISGRVLILPQPGFNLSVNIQQVFSATAREDIPSTLKDDDSTKEKAIQKNFLDQVNQIEYLSAPLSGFQDALVTKLNGTHLKPSYRAVDKPIVPFAAACEATRLGAKIDAPEIILMDIETEKVPYANHVLFDDGIAPLKPVTHGQFKFTRLDIFDKFGQAISAIDPAPANLIPPLYPILSEYFHPQHLSSKKDDPKYGQANTVGKDPFGYCQYAQYPHTINQDARMNASFLTWDKTAGQTFGKNGLWRPCTEWENPVWAYLIVNYAEYAVQLFLPDGQFYREVRLGGPSGATESSSWTPFEQPTNTIGRTDQFVQLDNLLQKFKDQNYLESFIRMINASLGSVAHTPNSYADYLSSIVGRPLALANIGYSLELAEEPFVNHSTDPRGVDPPKDLLHYDFSVKIGDKDRIYDGLVGYFDWNKDWENFGKELNLDTMYTYYPDKSSSTTTEIGTGTYQFPSVRPYHRKMGMSKFTVPTTQDLNAASQTSLDYTYEHYQNLRLAGVLFDPFSALHLYSGILPITTLQLPSWSLQSALQSITAFFHIGPLLITTPDLQDRYLDARKLSKETDLAALTEVEDTTDETDPANPPRFKGVPLPALASADWTWLQPYARPDTSAAATAAVSSGGAAAPAATPVPVTLKTSMTTIFNPFVVAQLDNKPKFEKGPYTAIEGYLQLKKPIMAAAQASGT